MKTLLVPLDLSAASPVICDEARALAQATGGRIVILHVFQPPPVMLNEYYAFDANQMTMAVAAGEKLAKRKLGELSERLTKRGCLVKTVYKSGQPVNVILDQANRLKADCIVIGSHGHGALHDLFSGSTTRGVLKNTRCPVLVIPLRPAKRRRK